MRTDDRTYEIGPGIDFAGDTGGNRGVYGSFRCHWEPGREGLA